MRIVAFKGFQRNFVLWGRTSGSNGLEILPALFRQENLFVVVFCLINVEMRQLLLYHTQNKWRMKVTHHRDFSINHPLLLKPTRLKTSSFTLITVFRYSMSFYTTQQNTSRICHTLHWAVKTDFISPHSVQSESLCLVGHPVTAENFVDGLYVTLPWREHTAYRGLQRLEMQTRTFYLSVGNATKVQSAINCNNNICNGTYLHIFVSEVHLKGFLYIFWKKAANLTWLNMPRRLNVVCEKVKWLASGLSIMFPA